MDTSVRHDDVPGIAVVGRVGVGRQRVVRSLTQFGSGAVYGVHDSTINNLKRGVAERVLYVQCDGKLQPPRKPDKKGFKRLAGLRDRLLTHLRPTTVVPREEYPNLYHGRKRVTYQQAYESLLSKAITRKDAYVSTFVKAEKINFSAKGDPAPRVIQPRSPRYNLEVGRYLKLFESELVHGFERMCGYNVILKGLNAERVAAQLKENWDNFGDPVAIGLDASRFDQHVSREALEFEHSIYNAVFRSAELRKLLTWQLVNKGFGRVGDALLKYVVEGCRMSGDINTGMGNCLLMSLMVLGFFERVGLTARLANNGDDCVVILDRRDIPRLATISEWFTKLGFKLTKEPIVDVFERIEFCQSQPVLVGGVYRMVRNPWTAMSKDCVSLLSWDTLASFNAWRNAIGTCGLELTRGVPVWEAFYRKIYVPYDAGGAKTFVYDSGMGYMARGVSDAKIDDNARVSFWLAFGIDPDLQVAMETSYPEIEYNSQPPLVSIYQIQQQSTNPLCLLSAQTRRTQPS